MASDFTDEDVPLLRISGSLILAVKVLATVVQDTILCLAKPFGYNRHKIPSCATLLTLHGKYQRTGFLA